MALSVSPSVQGFTKKEKAVNILLCLLVLGVGWFYYASRFLPLDKPARDWLKAAASLLFVACCLANLLFVRRPPRAGPIPGFCSSARDSPARGILC